MANKNDLPEVTEEVAKPSDDPIERMIDIAIEAQDGPSDTNTEAKTGEEAKPKAGEETPTSDDKKDSTGGAGDNKSQPKSDEKGKKDEKQTHSAKDLTLADGTVVKGGAERRLYEQRETARQQAKHYETLAANAKAAHDKLEGELRTLRETTQSLHGVDPNTIKIGVQIVKDLQTDPVGTMKKLLAEVTAQGYTIDQIGSGVDHLAIQRMIDARLPTNVSTEQSEQEILAEAKQEVDNFYNTYPDARPHDALLGRMLRDHPGLELSTAYFQLKDAFAEKGFDFHRSLEDNLADASTDQQQQEQPNNQQQPMPNGRAPVGDGIKPADEVKVAHEDTSIDDIVKAAMRENGLNIN